MILAVPIKFMRGYGQSAGVFSFETGRKCPGGPNTYFFRVMVGTGSTAAVRALTGLQGEKDIFVHLNRIIALHKNARAVGHHWLLPIHVSHATP